MNVDFINSQKVCKNFLQPKTDFFFKKKKGWGGNEFIVPRAVSQVYQRKLRLNDKVILYLMWNSGESLTPGISFKQNIRTKSFHRRNLNCLSYYDVHVSLSLQLSKTSSDLSKMAAIYLVDVDRTPVYTHYFDISYIPSTVFFFNGQHMKVDYG